MNRAKRRGVGNVNSEVGVVEACGPTRRWCAAILALFMLMILGASGCVETAECNAAVTCPASQVCYEYECRMRCESAAQCGDGQVCSPCQTIAGTHDQGKCFGADLYACVDGNS